MRARTRWLLVGYAIGIWVALVLAMVTDAHAATPPAPARGMSATEGPESSTQRTVDGLGGSGWINDTHVISKPGKTDTARSGVSQPTATPPTPPPVVALPTNPDQTGVRASAYTGKYYRAGDEGYRRCIVARESNGHYFSTGRNGYYQGAYQLTNALARGAAWEMTPELRVMFPKHWRLIRDTLLDTPASRWSRWFQDAAFWTVLNVDGEREGAAHWSGGRWRCWPGMAWSGR